MIDRNVFKNIDWRWVGVGYCLFVVFHLLPSYLTMGVGNLDRGFWLFIGLAVIAFYIGYRSRGFTIIEPAIAAILYDVTLTLEFKDFWGRALSHSWGIIYIWAVATLVIAVTSAWLGEIVQSKKEARVAAKT